MWQPDKYLWTVRDNITRYCPFCGVMQRTSAFTNKEEGGYSVVCCKSQTFLEHNTDGENIPQPTLNATLINERAK